MAKKTILFLCTIIVLFIGTSQVISANSDYVIITDDNGNSFYWNPNDYSIPNEVLVLLNTKIDLSNYENDGIKDFFGIDITKIEPMFNEENTDVSEIIFGYRIFTTEFYTPDEARVLFNGETIVILSTLNAYNPNFLDEDNDTISLGDINGNDKIDMTDYILLKRAYFGTYTFDDSQKYMGDINQNNKIDMTDYILLKRIYFGTYTL